jgi:hypothetical protein
VADHRQIHNAQQQQVRRQPDVRPHRDVRIMLDLNKILL